jgi:hypothetical protein
MIEYIKIVINTNKVDYGKYGKGKLIIKANIALLKYSVVFLMQVYL